MDDCCECAAYKLVTATELLDAMLCFFDCHVHVCVSFLKGQVFSVFGVHLMQLVVSAIDFNWPIIIAGFQMTSLSHSFYATSHSYRLLSITF